MKLFKVTWDNGMDWEDHYTHDTIFTSYEKAKEYFDSVEEGSIYNDEYLYIFSFESDIPNAECTKLDYKILPMVYDYPEYDEEESNYYPEYIPSEAELEFYEKIEKEEREEKEAFNNELDKLNELLDMCL